MFMQIKFHYSMKKLTTLLVFFATMSFATAQIEKSIENYTSCDIYVTMYYQDPALCVQEPGYSQTYLVKAGGFVLAQAPVGFEYVYADLTWEACFDGGTMSPFITVGAQGTCGCHSFRPQSVSAAVSCDGGCGDMTVFWEECGVHLTIN